MTKSSYLSTQIAALFFGVLATFAVLNVSSAPTIDTRGTLIEVAGRTF